MVNPGIRLKIYNHSTPEAVDAVKNGLVDFAVVSSPSLVMNLRTQVMIPLQSLPVHFLLHQPPQALNDYIS